MTKSELHAFLSSHKLGVLGYLSPDGAPRSALVGVAATPELEIVFDTVASSRKYGCLIANPAASFVIGWAGEQTVQLEGRAFLPSGDELRRYQEAYFIAWPDGRDRLDWPGMTHFVVRPAWIRFSDFDQRPPLIQEFVL